MTVQARKRFTIALLIIMVFLSFMNLMGAVLLNDTIAQYQLEDAAKGYNSTARSIGGIVALFSSFLIMGRMSKKVLLPIVTAVGIVSLVLMKAAGNSFPMYLACWAVLGVSSSYMDSLLSSNMADLYQGRESEKMMGLLHTTFSISAVLVPTLYTTLLGWLKGSGHAWNDIFLLVAGLGVVSLVLYLLAYPRGTSHVPVENAVPTAKDEKLTISLIKNKLTSSMLPGLILAMMLHEFFFNGYSTWLTRYVSVELNSGLGDIVLSVMWLGIMLSRMFVPRMPFSAKQYLRTAGFITGGLLLVSVAFANPVIMTIAAFLIGVVFGGMLTAIINISCTVTPENTMLATTSMGLAMSLAGTICSPVIGAIESAFGLNTGMAVLSIPILLSSIVMIITLRRDETTNQK